MRLKFDKPGNDMAFHPMQGVKTQKIAASATPTPVRIPENSPDLYMLVDGAALIFARWGDDTMTADDADIPLAPGAFGTFARGNATHIIIKGAGDVYITHGEER